jgi:hypothetical protein
MPTKRAPASSNDNAKVTALKRQLIANILRGIEGLSVRQAAPITGLSYTTISRLRRGLPSTSHRRREDGIIDYSLESLVGGVIGLGFPIRLRIGAQRVPSRHRIPSSNQPRERRPSQLPTLSEVSDAKIRGMNANC